MKSPLVWNQHKKDNSTHSLTYILKFQFQNIHTQSILVCLFVFLQNYNNNNKLYLHLRGTKHYWSITGVTCILALYKCIINKNV